MGKETMTEDKTGLDALGLTRNDTEPDTEEEAQQVLREMAREDLTDLQRNILVHWQMFPHLSQVYIASDLDAAQSTVSRTISRYGWLYDESKEEGEFPG